MERPESLCAGVGFLVQEQGGKFLFQKRDGNTDREPNMIAPFGGGCEDGEGSVSAAIREFEEELGIRVSADDLRYLGRFESHNTPGQEIDMFMVQDIDLDDVVLGEGRGFSALSIKEASTHSMVTTFTKDFLSRVDIGEGQLST